MESIFKSFSLESLGVLILMPPSSMTISDQLGIVSNHFHPPQLRHPRQLYTKPNPHIVGANFLTRQSRPVTNTANTKCGILWYKCSEGRFF